MNKYIIVDIETPMSFSAWDGIREVAAIAVEDGKIIDRIHLFDVWDEELSKTGYGRGLVAIQRKKLYIQLFKEFVEEHDCPLIAHNASFDKRFLDYWEWTHNKLEWFCTMRAIKYEMPELPSYKLELLLNEFVPNRVQKHTAIQDVIDLQDLLAKIKPTLWIPVGTKGPTKLQRIKQLKALAEENLVVTEDK